MARGRPATPLGAWGAIDVRQVGEKRFQASTRLRLYNGKVVRVRATGPSKTAATNRLKERCNERLEVRDSKNLSSNSRLSELLDYWLATKTDVRPQTLERYKRAINNHVKPNLGDLRLNEISPSILDAWFKTLPLGVVGNVRTVLSAALRLATRYELMRANPMAVVDIPAPEVKKARALSPEEVTRFQKQIATSGDENLIDVVDFCLCTGLRAGEVFALRWEDVIEDAQGNMAVMVRGTMAYSKENGNVRQDFGKTAAAMRPIPLAARAVEIVQKRRAKYGDLLEVVFPSSRGTYQWENNFNRQLRNWRGKEFSWVTIHTLRKTVASLVADELGPHKAADVLGHADSRLTERAYYERNRAGVPIAELIDKVVKGVQKVSK